MTCFPRLEHLSLHPIRRRLRPKRLLTRVAPVRPSYGSGRARTAAENEKPQKKRERLHLGGLASG